MTDIVERLKYSLSTSYSELRKEAAIEIMRLRAKITEMEKQEPAGTLHDDGCFVWRETAPPPEQLCGLEDGALPRPRRKRRNQMSTEFTREDRYIVFKMSDLGNSLKGDEIRRLAREYAEQRRLKGKKPLECVVVEKDWPEYEPTWKAIETRVVGTQAQPVPSVPDEDAAFRDWLDSEAGGSYVGVYEFAKAAWMARAALNAAPKPEE